MTKACGSQSLHWNRDSSTSMLNRSDSSFTCNSQYFDKCLIYNAFKYRCNGRCWNAMCSGCGFDSNPSTLFQTAPKVIASIQGSLILQVHLEYRGFIFGDISWFTSVALNLTCTCFLWSTSSSSLPSSKPPFFTTSTSCLLFQAALVSSCDVIS